MFRRKKIPPPLNPPIPQGGSTEEFDIELPYSLADQPRVFLHFLANNTKIDEDGKALIREWLEKYDAYLSDYLLQNHGFWGLMAANEISIHVNEQFYAAAKGAVDAAEQSLFDYLEKDIEGDE